jgi:hypothetical protein
MSDLRKFVERCQKNGFPNINADNLEITSPVDPNYNCIAWAAKENFRWWWPDEMGQAYWPSNAPREVTKEAFVKAYATIGFEKCNDSNFEEGYEKIMIYCKNGKPTHAARLIESYKWTSKLGPQYDVSHSYSLLDGDAYGNPELFMKRTI